MNESKILIENDSLFMKMMLIETQNKESYTIYQYYKLKQVTWSVMTVSEKSCWMMEQKKIFPCHSKV